VRRHAQADYTTSRGIRQGFIVCYNAGTLLGKGYGLQIIEYACTTGGFEPPAHVNGCWPGSRMRLWRSAWAGHLTKRLQEQGSTRWHRRNLRRRARGGVQPVRMQARRRFPRRQFDLCARSTIEHIPLLEQALGEMARWSAGRQAAARLPCRAIKMYAFPTALSCTAIRSSGEVPATDHPAACAADRSPAGEHLTASFTCCGRRSSFAVRRL